MTFRFWMILCNRAFVWTCALFYIGVLSITLYDAPFSELWIGFLAIFIATLSFVLPIDLLLLRAKFAGYRYRGFRYAPWVLVFLTWESMSVWGGGSLSLIQTLQNLGTQAARTSQRSAPTPFQTSEQDSVIARNPLEEPVIVEEPIIIVEEASSFAGLPISFTFMIVLALGLTIAWRAYQVGQVIAKTQDRSVPTRLTVSDLDIAQERRYVTSNLLDQGQAHRFRASILLFVMVGLIGLGVQLYLTAGALISADVGPTPLEQTRALHDRLALEEATTARQILADISERERVLTAIQSLGNQNARITDNQTPIVFPDDECRVTSQAVEALGLDIASLPAGTDFRCEDNALLFDGINFAQELIATDRALSQRIAINSGKLSSLQSTLEGIRGYISSNLGLLIEGNKPSAEETVQQLIASGVTRFGVLFVVIYLVQILVGIYRFSMRQAEFYESRANAMLLAAKEGNEIGTWKDDLFAKDIDFGKPPKSPSEHIKGLVSTFTGKRPVPAQQVESD